MGETSGEEKSADKRLAEGVENGQNMIGEKRRGQEEKKRRGEK